MFSSPCLPVRDASDAEVNGECKAHTGMDWSGNDIGTKGAVRLARVRGECKGLPVVSLGLSTTDIGAQGAGELVRVLGECKKLDALDVTQKWIGAEAAGKPQELLGAGWHKILMSKN
eukprot:1993983-Rhodomonas_salina.1